jgi:hypothetical protein
MLMSIGLVAFVNLAEPSGGTPDALIQCAYGFNETTQQCTPDPGPSCDTYTWIDPDTNETHEEESCTDGYSIPSFYTVDGAPPVLMVPGTNVMFPLHPSVVHFLGGMTLVATVSKGIRGIRGK